MAELVNDSTSSKTAGPHKVGCCAFCGEGNDG